MIYLEFPDQERPRMTYRVYHRMPVSLLYRAIASRILDCDDNQIRIYVGDQCLLHCCTITDRYFPGLPDVPTVFILPDCTVHVRRVVMNSGEQDSIPLPPTIPIENEITGALPGGQRRVSTRVPVPRGGNLQHTIATSRVNASRRPVRDRWFYDPVFPTNETQGSSDVSMALLSGVTTVSDTVSDTMMLASAHNDQDVLILGPDIEDPTGRASPSAPLTPVERKHLVTLFKKENRQKRRQFKRNLHREWESQVAPAFDQENDKPDAPMLMEEEVAYTDFMRERLDRFD